jgi:chromosome segregation ATPase
MADKLDMILEKLEELTQVTRSLREGQDELFAKLENLTLHVVRLDERLTSVEERLTAVENRLTSLEGRVDRLEGRMDQLENRMDQLEGRMDQLQGQVDQLDERTSLIETTVNKIHERQIRHDSILDALAIRSIAHEAQLLELRRNDLNL